MQPPPPSSFKTFSSAQNKTLYPLSRYIVPPTLHGSDPWPPPTWVSSMDLPIMNNSYRWSHSQGLLCLASSTLQCFQSSYCSLYQSFIACVYYDFFFPLMDIHIVSNFWLLWIHTAVRSMTVLVFEYQCPLWGCISRSGIYG